MWTVAATPVTASAPLHSSAAGACFELARRRLPRVLGVFCTFCCALFIVRTPLLHNCLYRVCLMTVFQDVMTKSSLELCWQLGLRVLTYGPLAVVQGPRLPHSVRNLTSVETCISVYQSATFGRHTFEIVQSPMNDQLQPVAGHLAAREVTPRPVHAATVRWFCGARCWRRLGWRRWGCWLREPSAGAGARAHTWVAGRRTTLALAKTRALSWRFVVPTTRRSAGALPHTCNSGM